MGDLQVGMVGPLAFPSASALTVSSTSTRASMPYSRHSKLLKPSDGDEAKDGPAHQGWYCPKRILKSLSPKKPLPPPPPTPAELPGSIPCTTLDPLRSAVEISNYPPTLTKMDIRGIFSDFHIADFDMRSVRSFTAPLRVRIEVAGKGQAEKAVRELDGVVIQGKKIAVKAVEPEPYENKEAVLNELADELKVQIINAARAYNEDYSSMLLFVREWMTATVYYAFLQAREPITAGTPPQEVQDSLNNLGHWIFLAAGTASTRDDKGRLKALRDLKDTLDKQGEAMLAWEEWEGSELLHYDA